ncbi:stage VI sporulation protein D [Fictibacillus aquaticus]|uniref:Stage VI sporulation protein D n=1 Tax=Fictibacillus aquaticus TaxID=2021314 RepID=A0A235F9Y8_9BACL|nr:stage VI sporulation protein D [Fictibacillus aquaticus]OYD58082.1 stage VI sporulation protein D [Fictibacillus aquaticus]
MNQSKLRFSIEESVWLKKGQEVAEVYALSLDPEITITEESGQISITGALVLSGEYEPANTVENENSDMGSSSFSEQVSYRSLTQLSVKEDGLMGIKHRFPVDITIPSYRVERADQIMVAVESFDYELPNPACLELSASICITGIKDERPAEPETKPAAEVNSTEQAEYSAPGKMQAKGESSSIFAPFQFEARAKYSEEDSVTPEPLYFEPAEARNPIKETVFEFKAQGEDKEGYYDNSLHSLKSIAFQDAADTQYARNEEAEETPDVQEEFEGQPNEESSYEQQQYEELAYEEQTYNAAYEAHYEPVSYQESYSSSYNPNHRPQQWAEQQQWGAEQQQQWVPEHQQQWGAEQQQQWSAEQQPAAEEYAEETVYTAPPVQQTEQEKPKKSYTQDENALYLTKMLDRNEEKFSKMKMYILQRGDSLDRICDRYDVSINTLLRVNRSIQQDQVCAGQIIYIPVSSSR